MYSFSAFAYFCKMHFQFFADYLKHRLIANNRHGTHSPFVYSLADEVIYDFSHKPEYKSIEALRKKLLNDDSGVLLQDFLPDSGFAPEKNYKISRLLKLLMNASKIDQLLFRIIRAAQTETTFEMHSNFGITTAYLAAAKPSSKVIAIESEEALREIATKNLQSLKVENVQQLPNGYTLENTLTNISKLDVLYIHAKNSAIDIFREFEMCLPKIHVNSFLIFDHIYADKKRKASWSEIKNHPQVTVTIDLFWIGLVYFRKGQAKQHFKLKL